MASIIAACSSGSTPCAIAIVRLSRPDAFSVLDGVFVPNAGKPVSLRRPRTLHYGRLLAKDGLTLDLCLAACFPGPHSYTGEDLAEIYCHGSQAAVAALLDHCFARGAVPAPPGEFTKRAFLAGRLDLTEAEAVADLIHSQSELGAKAAVAQLEGSVGSRVKAIRERIMSLPRTGTTPTDSRRAQDRLAMPASIWLPTGPLMEYGRPPYGSPTARLWNTAGRHMQDSGEPCGGRHQLTLFRT